MLNEAVTPSEIFTQLDAQPPLMRSKFFKKEYFGMEVDWPVTFADAWEGSADTVRVAFRFESGNIQAVVGDASLSHYPQLRHLRRGESLRVRGRIRSVSSLWIELDITELLFCLEPVAA